MSDTIKAHQKGRCDCRKTMNTTGRYARACAVPGTQEAGRLAMRLHNAAKMATAYGAGLRRASKCPNDFEVCYLEGLAHSF